MSVTAPASRAQVRSTSGYRARRAWHWLTTRGVVYLLVVAFALIQILPLAWMLTTALKPDGEVVSIPPRLHPDHLALGELRHRPDAMKFTILLKNTVTITAISLVGVLLSSSLVAYPFARLRFPGKSWLFLLVLSTMMLP